MSPLLCISSECEWSELFTESEAPFKNKPLSDSVMSYRLWWRRSLPGCDVYGSDWGEGRQRDEHGRSFKPIKENQMIQTLNCIKQCDTATCFLPSAGTIETFYTTVIFLWSCEPFSDVRGARCSAAVWGELCLHPLNCSDGHRRTNGRSRRVPRSAMCVKPLTRACSHTQV